MLAKGFTLVELLIATVLSLFVILMLSYGYKLSSEVMQEIFEKKRQSSFERVCTIIQEQLIGVEGLKLKKSREKVELSYLTSKAQTLQSPYARVVWHVDKDGVIYTELPPYGGKESYKKKVLNRWMSIDGDGNTLMLSFGDRKCYITAEPRVRSKIFWKGW